MKYSAHTYNLRQKKPILPRKNTSKGQMSIDYLGTKIFENLPIEIKEEGNLKHFKILLKRWLTITMK